MNNHYRIQDFTKKVSESKSLNFPGSDFCDKSGLVFSRKDERPSLSPYFKNDSSFDWMERTPVRNMTYLLRRSKTTFYLWMRQSLKGPLGLLSGPP